MPAFLVKVKDKSTKRESVIRVNGAPQTVEEAKEHVEKMPTANGGKHPGFEVLDALELDADGAPIVPDQK